jgi:hypothetical protein
MDEDRVSFSAEFVYSNAAFDAGPFSHDGDLCLLGRMFIRAILLIVMAMLPTIAEAETPRESPAFGGTRVPLSTRQSARRPYLPTSPVRPAHNRPGGATQVRRWSSGLGRRESPDLHWDQDPQPHAAARSCQPQEVRARRAPPRPIGRRRQA